MLRKIKILAIMILIVSLAVIFAETNDNKSISTLTDYTTSKIINDASVSELLYENDQFLFSFKDERDVLIIEDKRNGYVWKSGLDIASSKAVKKALRSEEPLGYEPLEQKLNETYTGIANSLITVEYYDDSLGIKRLASAAADGAESTLEKVDGSDNHFVLDIKYSDKDIQLKVHLFFTEDGYDIQVYDEEITGMDTNDIAAILLNPFLGASGGEYALYDPETGKHGEAVKKPAIEGYVVVPDGPGALIEFNDYNVSLKQYKSKVYGENLSKGIYNENLSEIFNVPFKNPTMPLYGIAHTNSDAAFIGYASQGDENMEIVVMPEENTTLYTWAYPRFVKNQSYYQVFNKRGEGFFTLFDEPNTFDIEFHYNFIAEDEDPNITADYSGMAYVYRNYLLEEEILIEQSNKDVAMRIDFIMSDQKKSVLGYENIVVTTADQVSDILDQLVLDGVSNISSGLYGWQKTGVTTAEPWKTDFTRDIGSEKTFKNLIETQASRNIDVSFAQDYLNFTDENVKVSGNAIKHMNNWYLTNYKVDDVPFLEFYYAKPQVSVSWLKEQLKDLKKTNIQSHTIEGIGAALFSEHGKKVLQETEVIALYQETLGNISEDLKINMSAPNQYLWAYTDRYLKAPVFSTQYLIETETVPFLSMILNGSMEVYAPYSNFSFSGEKDLLKMIDYNIYPSFMITGEASYLLSSTNSLDFYSTEFEQYKNLIPEVYQTISDALSEVSDTKWLSRNEVEEQVFVNTYENGMQILINYNDYSIEYKNNEILPLSYKIFY